MSDHYFLASNENGSIAYDLRDYSEFEIPYDQNNNVSQWQVKHADVVRLIQSGNETQFFIINLDQKTVLPTPQESNLLYLSDNFSGWRTTNPDDTELHIITNLNTLDSIIITTDDLHGFHSDINDYAFVYFNNDQVLKLNQSDFTTSVLLDIPDDEEIEYIKQLDSLSIIITDHDALDNILRIYNANDSLLLKVILESGFRKIHKEIISGRILFSDDINKLHSLNIFDGTIKKYSINYNIPLHDLNDEYLTTYTQDFIYLISKEDESIKSKYYQLSGTPYNITSLKTADIFYVSFDTRTEGDKPLVTVDGESINQSDIIEETSGISSYFEIWKSDASSKLILKEDNIYSFNENGYEELSDSYYPLSLYNETKSDATKLCWSEKDIENNIKIKCFQNNEVIDFGNLTNISNWASAGLINYSVKDDILIYYISSVSGDREIRIKYLDQQLDTLLTRADYLRSMIEVENTPFFAIEDLLFTYNFEKETLQYTEIPLTHPLDIPDFGSVNGITYVATKNGLYKIENNQNTQVIEDQLYIPFNRLPIYGDYVVASNLDGQYFYDGDQISFLPLTNDQHTNYISNNLIAITNSNFYENISPIIYNLQTQESILLDDYFADSKLHSISYINDNLLLLHQIEIDNQEFYALDYFNDDFSSWTNYYSIPKDHDSFYNPRTIESDTHVVYVMANTLLFVNKVTGVIDDELKTSQILRYDQIQMKEGVLYFVRFDEFKKRQLYKYKPNILSNDQTVITDFDIFPNPSDHTITISAKNPIDNITVFDNMGRQILTTTTITNEVNINTTTWISGVYIIEILSDGVKKSKKLLKM